MEVYIAQKNAWNKEFHVYGVSFEFYVHIEYSNFNLNFNLDRAVTSKICAFILYIESLVTWNITFAVGYFISSYLVSCVSYDQILAMPMQIDTINSKLNLHFSCNYVEWGYMPEVYCYHAYSLPFI